MGMSRGVCLRLMTTSEGPDAVAVTFSVEACTAIDHVDVPGEVGIVDDSSR